jgi:two-component system chemotaxis response regulator CheB
MSDKSGKIQLLIVDDSAFVRRAIIRMFENDPLIQVVDVAANGEMALDRIKSIRPDVVTLDIMMPVMDGLSSLARIMKECPVPVIMLSSLTEKGGENTIKALELGAVDFVDKSAAGGPMDFSALHGELRSKIIVAAKVEMRKLAATDEARILPQSFKSSRRGKSNIEIVLIGTSTGGPPALQTILSKLPSDFPLPIVIVQHMPLGFTRSLAERLDRMCQLPAAEVTNGEQLIGGKIYVAPSGTHLKIDRHDNKLVARLDTFPADALHRPSVDALLESSAKSCGSTSLTVVLTGMGRDGSVGAKAIKNAGGKVIVESEETAIVFGMPKAVMDTVSVDGVYPLNQMTEKIISIIEN